MKFLRKLFLGLGAAFVVLVAAVLVWLWLSPPELMRVAANYSAKIVCSNVFLVGRDPEIVLHEDVQAPGNPLLRLMRIQVDREHGTVSAGLLGFIGNGLAVYRSGRGCTALPDGKSLEMSADSGAPVAFVLPQASESWPEGSAVRPDAEVMRILSDERLAGPGMRAIVVVRDGRIVGERYASGFDANTPLLGWSMTKTVTAGLIGLLVKDGRLTLEASAGWPAVSGDERSKIRIADLMAMSSGLHFNEEYGDVSDVTRMLYLEDDMAGFARAQPLEHPVGEVWSYSSGTAVVLARIFQDAAGPLAQRLVRQRLFAPLGMTSAVIESDQHGTLVGSSYMYASARDWARYGELLRMDGLWQGEQILPPGFVASMVAPVAASGGQYGHGQVWRWVGDASKAGENPDAREFGIPEDSFWMQGHDGQYTAIIPSRHLVVVRMGLTPGRLHYHPQALVQALLALPGP